MDDKELLLKAKIPGPETGIEIKKSICTICDPTGLCGMDLYIKDGEIIKVEGTKENPHNNGRLCSKGGAQRQYIYNKERLKTPLKRVGAKGTGEFEPISWDEALDIVAEKFKEAKGEFGAESVVFYSGYSKWFRPFLQRLAYVFGSPNFLTESSACNKAMVMASKLNGTPGSADIKNSKCLMIWSANPFHSRHMAVPGLLAAKERGLKIIVIDPRITPTVDLADIHLQVRPGTDGALALAMAYVMINENLYDEHFVNNYTFGFEEYCKYVQDFTPEKAEEITGVPAEKIRAAARMFATVKPSSIMPSSQALVHHTNGIQNYRAIFALTALTGNYDVAGGNRPQQPSWGHLPGGIITNEHDFECPRKLSEMAPRIGEDKFPLFTNMFEEGQAMCLPSQIRTQKPYPIKAIIGLGLNHLMWPDSSSFAESLKEVFFVNVDLFMTESCKYADIILPACSSVERSELRVYPEHYIIYTQPAIEPCFEARPDTDILYDLAQRLEVNDPLFNAGIEASLDWVLEPSGITIEELKKHPAGMKVLNPLVFPEKKYLKSGFKTPSGKVEFKSLILEEAGIEGLPVYTEPEHSPLSTPELAKEFPFIINTGSRLPNFCHTRTFRMAWTASLRPEPTADINRRDAESLAIKQGGKIKISTPKGSSITLKANLTEAVQPGVVHMQHGQKEANVNDLLENDYLDPISGFAGFKSFLGKMEAIQ